MKVLFVCRGNIGRSQMSEAFFNMLASGTEHTALSAGTKVVDKEGNSKQGEKLKEREGAANVVAVMAELGLDVTEAVRDQLSPAMIESADLVISMAELETVPEYLATSPKVRFWTFPDPKNASLEDTRQLRDDIRVKVEELLVEISGK